jgi:translation initiation factor 2 alpha subunit (eIF-2alpha)
MQLNNAVTNIQEQLKNVATKEQVQNLADLVAEYESQGLSRDEALKQAIQDLSEQTGQSVEEIQAAINANQDLIIDLGLDIDAINNAVTNIQEQLKM